ncbi:MAG: serine/threonine-protein kinase [Pirellulaceae bacterium]
MSDSNTELVQTKAGEKLQLTQTSGGDFALNGCAELIERYSSIIGEKRMNWTTHLKLLKLLGSGGQGVVFLSERKGADGFTLPVALKIFSPDRYRTPEDYDLDMARIGAVAGTVAGIQHDNLLLVHNFLDRNRIRMMVMEWVEGYDLRRLLTPRFYGYIKERFSERQWKKMNDVLVTAGPDQPRFKPGVAIAIIQSCLNALAALHRNGIVHADIKPANIMLKQTGQAKIIDIGSAFSLDQPPERRACTPAYASLEVLEGKKCTPLADLASIGYVTVELLSGRSLFSGATNFEAILNLKKNLVNELPKLMPREVATNSLLMSFIEGLVAPNPEDRFHSAEAALTMEDGAAAFLRQLIKGDMASEYENDLRIWIEELLEIDAGFGDEAT